MDLFSRSPIPLSVPTIIARSALSIRAAHQILLIGLRTFDFIIDFCREDLRAASRLLSTGGLRG